MAQARASWICSSIFKSPNYGCGRESLANGVGGSYPILFDAFNVNVASLPSFPTPLGFEVFTDNSKFNFALIKGVERVGMGLTSSSTQGQFFSNISNVDVAQTQAAAVNSSITQSEQHDAPNVNVGSAVTLIETKPISISIGAAGRYNKDSQNWRANTGITLRTPYINGGASFSKDVDNNSIINLTAGGKLGGFLVDYSHFRQASPVLIETSIFSTTFSTGTWNFSYARRKQKNGLITPETIAYLNSIGVPYREVHVLLGINFRASDKWGFGFFSNYILGKGSSLVFQYLF